MRYRLESTAAKLARALGASAGITVFIVSLAVVVLLYRYGEEQAVEGARADAGYLAGELAERLNRSVQITQEVQSLVKAAAESRHGSRIQVINQLKDILEREPDVQGVWLIAEPNGFDGRDRAFRGAFAASARGEFYPYWYRAADGRLVQDTTGARDNVAEDRASPFYRMPIEQNRIVITEPYVWRMGEGAGELKSMTSIAGPARAGGRLVGAVGVDLYLKELSSEIQQRSREGKTKFALLSDKGVVVVSNEPSLLRRGVSGLPLRPGLFKRAAAAGTAGVVGDWSGERAALISLPVAFEASRQPWRLIVAQPTTAVLGQTWKHVFLALLGGGLLSILAGAIGARMGRSLGRPITEMANAMRRMSQGDMSPSIPLAEGSAELHAMGAALEAFRDYAARASTAEAARRQAEQLARERSAQLRITSANLPLQEFLELIVEEMLPLTRADGVAVQLIENDELVHRAASGDLLVAVGQRIPLAGSLAGEAVRLRATLVSEDTWTDPRVYRPTAHPPRFRSIVIAPLFDGERAFGVVKTSAVGPSAFSAAHAADLGVFADMMAAAIARELAREAAETANRAKSEFLANMSHEIRTPLNGIVGTAEVLARSNLGAHERELVEIIKSSGETLAGLLSDILDQARIEAGQLHIEVEPFHLGDLVRAVERLWRLRADERGVVLAVQVAPEVDGVFRGDALRIRQILTNFVSNAVKFTTAGSIAVTAARTPEGRVRLAVRDTGIGFSQEQRGRIFGRFEQADGSITRSYGGTGLGLAICQQLTRLMDGEIDCESAAGEGATFFVDLPLEPSESLPAQPAAGEAKPLNDQALKILIADDHPTNRKVLELMLQQLGAVSHSVENGACAVEALAAEAFDVVLMDMQMPVMDGLCATRAIREHEARNGLPRTPVIMLTANALREHVAASLAAGADGHVAKPVTGQGLVHAIADALAAAAAVALEDHGLAGEPGI